MRWTTRLATAAIAFGCLGSFAFAVAETPDEIIAARQAGYKHVGDLVTEMKNAVGSGADVTPFASKAREIAAWGRKGPTLFPPGTETGHDTHALPTVWSDRAGFDAAAARMPPEADKLAAIAETGDKAAFAAQFKALGATCGNCHRDYRAKL